MDRETALHRSRQVGMGSLAIGVVLLAGVAAGRLA